MLRLRLKQAMGEMHIFKDKNGEIGRIGGKSSPMAFSIQNIRMRNLRRHYL